MSYLGSWKIDDYVPIPAACHRFSTGAAYAPTSLTYSIYEDGGTTGIDEDVDMVVASPFDGIVGCYLARRQLTAAAGFEKGKNYTVVVKATVDGVSAIQMHTFQIEAEVDSNSVSTAVPKSPATLAAGDVSGNLPADLQTIKTQAITCGAGVTVLASVGTAATSTAQTGDSYGRLGAPVGASISADLAVVDGIVDTIVARIIGTLAAGTHNPQSGDGYARMGAPAGASISADIAVVDGIVDTIVARIIGTLLAGNHNPQSGDSYAIVNSGTFGNSALKTLIDAVAVYIDTEVAAILAAVDTEVAVIKAKTDLLPASPAATGDIPTAAQVADKILGRNLAGGADGTRTIQDALRALRNRVRIAAGTMTVYQEDDTTPAWTAPVTTDPAAEPIIEVDPA